MSDYAANLYIPSLDRHGDIITIVNPSRAEAQEFVDAFTAKARTARKQGSHPTPVTESMEFYEGSYLRLKEMVETDDALLPNLLEKLATADIKNFRGTRAVFLDVENDVIGIGTTVVYNQNWSTAGVPDPSVVKTILDTVNQLDEEEEEEEDEDN
jgi:hypothetical protein